MTLIDINMDCPHGNTVQGTLEEVCFLGLPCLKCCDDLGVDEVNVNSMTETVRQRTGNGPTRVQQARGPVQNPAPTDKQMAFLRSLRSERGIPATDPMPASKKDASTEIERLLAMPRRAAIITDEPNRPPLVGGTIMVNRDNKFIKIVQGKKGFYGKEWTGTGWEYAAGLLRGLVREINAEEAAKWGHEYHRCIFCTRPLSDDGDNRSVAVGYGPICAADRGLPWG